MIGTVSYWLAAYLITCCIAEIATGHHQAPSHCTRRGVPSLGSKLLRGRTKFQLNGLENSGERHRLLNEATGSSLLLRFDVELFRL
jgi:hypothetical protein